MKNILGTNKKFEYGMHIRKCDLTISNSLSVIIVF